MQLHVPVSVGEVLDKITILQIKLVHIDDVGKRVNVQNELDALLPLVAGYSFTNSRMQTLIAELKSVNEALWDIEDDIREKEASKNFDDEFVRLARAVYVTNDKRAAIKKQMNLVEIWQPAARNQADAVLPPQTSCGEKAAGACQSIA